MFYVGIYGQNVYPYKYSGGKASMQTPVPLTFIHGEMILPYTFNTI